MNDIIKKYANYKYITKKCFRITFRDGCMSEIKPILRACIWFVSCLTCCACFINITHT